MKSTKLILLGALCIAGATAQASPTPHKVRRAQLVSTPKPTVTVSATPEIMVPATPTSKASVAATSTNSNGSPIGGLVVFGVIVAIIWQGVKRFVVNRPPSPPPPEELEVQRQILDDLRSGITPSRVNAPGYFCKSGEKILYAFNNAKYYRLKGHAHYVGGSRGVSVRIMKGVSYRVGAHHGHREITQSMDFQGTGALVVTNQAINFIGPTSCRVLFKHIIDFKWYKDGMGFDTDAQTGNRYAFGNLRTADVEFLGQAVNLIN